MLTTTTPKTRIASVFSPFKGGTSMQRTSWINRSRKRVGVVLAAGMALGLAGTAQAANIAFQNEVDAKDPFAFYRFNESSGTTASDISGNDRDGNYVGSPTFGQTGMGIDSDNAVAFNGTDQHMGIPNSQVASLGSSLHNVTFEAIFSTTDTSESNLFGTFNDGSTTAVQFLMNRSDGTHRFALRANNGDDLRADINSTLLPANGEFHHLMIAVDLSQSDQNDRVKIYVNGANANADLSYGSGILNENSTFADFDHTFAVGARDLRGVIDNHLNSVIDEFVIYDKTLTAEDAANHYAAALIPEPGSLALLAAGAGLILLRRRRN